jgi:serine/threonine protein kinase
MDKPFLIRVLHGGLSTDDLEREKFFDAAKRESEAAGEVLPAVIDFGTDREGNVYCVYEALTGDTLRSVIDNDGQFPVHTAISLGSQIAFGLAASHEAGLIHGNLTAHNVLLANTPDDAIVARLIDFGSANPIIADKDDAVASDFAYLAPELCAGADHADEKSDIYSAGVIVYEMLAGVAPFTGEKPTDVMLRHIEEAPAPLSAFRLDIPDGLETVILKALSKNAEMRHASASGFADELAGIGSEHKPKAAAASGGIWKTALMMFVGIGLLAAALIYATSVKQTDPITSLQPDANGQPVQPLNPATGIEERNLATIPGSGTDVNSNLSIPPGTLPGGDGYDPWANARSLQPPGGTVTIPSDSGSLFTMEPGCTILPSGIVICPTVVPQKSPSPTPRSEAVNTNTQAPPGTPATRPSPAATRTPPSTPRPSRSPASNSDESPSEQGY